jgi:hypothetical protein
MRDVKKLNHFLGKVCTVFTYQTNRNYKEENPVTFLEQIFNYFVGVIESIDDDGVMLTQTQTGQKTFMFMHGIIGIAEEQVLDPSVQEDAEIIEKFNALNPKETIKKPGPFVDPAALAKLSKQAQS